LTPSAPHKTAGLLQKIQPVGENPEVDCQKQYSEQQVKSTNKSAKTYQLITVVLLHAISYQTRSSAIAEELRDALVSTNPATTKHPI